MLFLDRKLDLWQLLRQKYLNRLFSNWKLLILYLTLLSFRKTLSQLFVFTSQLNVSQVTSFIPLILRKMIRRINNRTHRREILPEQTRPAQLHRLTIPLPQPGHRQRLIRLFLRDPPMRTLNELKQYLILILLDPPQPLLINHLPILRLLLHKPLHLTHRESFMQFVYHLSLDLLLLLLNPLQILLVLRQRHVRPSQEVKFLFPVRLFLFQPHG